MTRITVKFLIGAALLASLIVGFRASGSAWAGSRQGSAAAQSKVSDKELKAFAKAYVEYHRIKRSYEPQLRATKDEKAKEKIAKEGNEKVRRVLLKQGFTPQKYNQVFVAVNGNPELRQKALELIRAERQTS